MFSLSILFLSLPLYFSHVFMHFGVVMGDGASFERQKMYLFFFLVCSALIETILTRYDDCVRIMREYWYVFLGVLLIPFVPTVLYEGSIDASWIRGSYEKFHGFFLYSTLIILVFTLALLNSRERQRLAQLSLIPAGIVAIVAILEGLGVNVFLPVQPGAWGDGARTISTLGNPNYLAGYLLIILPLTQMIRVPERYILMILILLALMMTWSYIGLALAGIYILYHILGLLGDRYSLSSRVFSIVFASVILLSGIVGYTMIPPDKLLSFVGRWVLMREVWMELIRFPAGLITGWGPESILRFFSESRSTLVDSYFPRESIIDSSHNILLDIVFQYGIVIPGVIGYCIYKNWKTQNPYARASWILGIMFLMFNPYIVTHLALISLALSLHDDRS